MNSPRPALILITGVLLIITACVSGTPARPDRIEIEDPRTGTIVGAQMRVQGIARVLRDVHIWVLARRSDFSPLWWPQQEVALDRGTGRWETVVHFGVPADVGSEFDIVAVAVNAEGHLRLREYWTDAMGSGNWGPIEVPPPLMESVRVRVRKRDH